MAENQQSLIPQGHTFINNKAFVTTRTANAVKELLEKLDKRDPDLFNMYIYNDFFNYAGLDLVDKQLSAIHSKIVKKDWTEAYYLFETLSVFQQLGSLNYPMIDDGERVELTDKVFGASFVTIVRALKNENRLDVEHFPSLETVLGTTSAWGLAMTGFGGMGKYYKVANGIGRRLFKDKSPETIALEKARVEEWLLTLPAEEQEEIKKMREEAEEDEDEEDEEDDGEWFEEKGYDEDYDHRNFVLSKVWKEYKGHLQTCPTKPLRGPPEWDISKWSAAQRAQFSFDNMD
ncbi:hypothetical protein BXZ70DRAFT_342219 [Cristinia sonorae]|uniref:Uncharacterized protein n=1 Tax=Cristinia sonorae TaxID=1940300 RepID=A0A8K0UKY8_9AGAR|nr:hypothetical protein BXZ70DRAFT_342219 [Cristinia sonorae]